jgi:hypothetical protein
VEHGARSTKQKIGSDQAVGLRNPRPDPRDQLKEVLELYAQPMRWHILCTTHYTAGSLVRWCLGPLGVVGSAFTTFSSSGCCHSSDDFQTTAHLRPLHWRRLSRTERTPVATVSKSLGAGTWVQLPPRGIEDV